MYSPSDVRDVVNGRTPSGGDLDEAREGRVKGVTARPAMDSLDAELPEVRGLLANDMALDDLVGQPTCLIVEPRHGLWQPHRCEMQDYHRRRCASQGNRAVVCACVFCAHKRGSGVVTSLWALVILQRRIGTKPRRIVIFPVPLEHRLNASTDAAK